MVFYVRILCVADHGQSSYRMKSVSSFVVSLPRGMTTSADRRDVTTAWWDGFRRDDTLGVF